MSEPGVGPGEVAGSGPNDDGTKRLEQLLLRGPKAHVVSGLEAILVDPATPVGGLVGRPPTLDSIATKEADGSRTRIVLAKVDKTDGGRAVGTTSSLLAADGTLVDTARVDQRGLVLLRFPHGTGADLGAQPGKLRLGTAPLIDITIPQGEQHVVVRAEIDPAAAVGIAGNSVDEASDLIEGTAGELDGAKDQFNEALHALEEAVAALAAASASAEAVNDAATAVGTAAAELTDATRAVSEAAAALNAAATALAGEVPTDSVISRLPVTFSPKLGDAVVRLLAVAEGPIPGIDSATEGISTSRMPLIKELAVFRVVVEDPPPLGGIGAPPDLSKRLRRFLIRIRQEWYFLGLTLGELARVDSLDPASITGTLDATLTAHVQAGLALDAATASRLQAALSGTLSAQAAIDGALDIAVAARLDARLKAAAKAGLRPGGFIPIIPDVGADIGARLRASLDIHAHTDLSVRSSLLAAARVNAAASLVNQLRVQISAALEASATVNAKLMAQINPSLARAVNLLRFVLYDVYAVTSKVEDVVEIIEFPVFREPPGPHPFFLVFPPTDIVEYRPLFEPALLEPRLAPHFELLRRGLAELEAGGEPIRSAQILVEFIATDPGADLSIRIGGQSATVRLRSGSPAATCTIQFSQPVRAADLTEARLSLSGRVRTDPRGVSDLLAALAESGIFGQATEATSVVRGTAQVTRIEIRYNGAGVLDDQHDFQGLDLAVTPTRLTAHVLVSLSPQPRQFNPFVNPLVRHVNHNKHYYLGLLAEAAIVLPSLRQDAPQLQEVPEALWKLPLLGFEADRALILMEPPADDPTVRKLVEDEGTSTIVQLAAAGFYTEVAQGRMQIAEVAGLAHPALQMPQLPLPNITGLDVLSNAGGLGSANLVAALLAAAPLLQQSPNLPNLAALASLLAAGRPPNSPPIPNPT